MLIIPMSYKRKAIGYPGDRDTAVRLAPGVHLPPRPLAFLAVAIFFSLWGCGSRRVGLDLPWATSQAGSTDHSLLYAADSQHDLLVVIDARTEVPRAQVKVGRVPASIAVGVDDSIYVANRGDRSVSVIRRGVWKEAARIPTGVEPAALALSLDGRLLYVVNNTSLEDPEIGTLMAVDLQTQRPLWILPIGRDPRQIRVLEGHRAQVRLHRERATVEVDLDAPRIVRKEVLLSLR
jgi:YVTN family beta-propeller protein